MTYSNRNLSLRAGLIAGVALLAMTSGAAVAGEGSDSLRAVFASDGEITKSEAKRLAESHFRQLGYTRIGRSQMSARISSVRFADGLWQIIVAYGGNVGHNRALILIDGSTGRLLESPLVEYATGAKFKRDVSDTEMAETQAKKN